MHKSLQHQTFAEDYNGGCNSGYSGYAVEEYGLTNTNIPWSRYCKGVVVSVVVRRLTWEA